MSDNTEVLVAIAKLEGKLDLALKQAEDHETRIRLIEAKPQPDQDTDQRLKALEERRTVSPGQLWTGLLSVLTAGGLVFAILDRFKIFGG